MFRHEHAKLQYEKTSGYMLGLKSTEKGEYDEEALCDALDDVAKEWFNIMAGRKRKAAKRGQGFMEGFALGQQKQRQQGGRVERPHQGCG